MKVAFFGQPLQTGVQAAEWIQQQLNNLDVTSLQIGVAWMKRSGLSRLQADLVRFRERGGVASAIIGIDEGGATQQGLRLALDLFNEVYIFHDPSSRTFHPKVYMASGASGTSLLVGSSNVTAGGLFSNYEASLGCILDSKVEEDQNLLVQVAGWFATLHSDSAVCKKLDEDLLHALSEDMRYKIGDEDQQRRPQWNIRDRDSVTTDTIGQSLFGRASIPKTGLAPRVDPERLLAVTKRSARKIAISSRIRTRRRGATPGHSLIKIVQSPSIESVTVTPQRWYKQMSASDAQQPRTPNSNPTGNLKLTRAKLDIDQVTYFRQEMFNNVAWASEQNQRGVKEEAIVPFEIIIEEQIIGQVNLKIDHAAYRVADQSNVSTWLHWGELQQILSITNYRGAWVIVERDNHGRFRLEITWTSPVQNS